MEWYRKAEEAAEYIKELFGWDTDQQPDTAIILGSGSDEIVKRFTEIKTVPYNAIPHLKATTFHKGTFTLVKTTSGKQLLIVCGRLHYYEGYSMQEVTFPVRILKAIGIQSLYMTNAAGGLNPDFSAGDIILVKDHINLLPEHPLRGPNDDRLGIRFPDLSEAYSKRLRNKLGASYRSLYDETIKEGVYVSLQGPSLETPAEYKFLNIIGGDMVGMSTVPEVIVANHSGIKVAVLSIVTNVCYPPEIVTETTLEEVIEVAQTASGKIGALLETVIDQDLEK